MSYDEIGKAQGMAVDRMPRMPTLTERMQSKKKALEEELKDVNEALAALKEDPRLERLVNSITRVQHRL